MPFLSQIYVFPVKSFTGFSVDHWPVVPTGLRYDRKWMLIDENGQFLSQRRLPKMTLIKTRITDGQLIISASGEKDHHLPLDSEEGEDIPVHIWTDKCTAKSTDPEIDAWLSRILDYPCRLVYHPDTEKRKVDPRYAAETDETAFSDGFPFLLANEASLAALNTAMQLEFSMLRFRPNLVVAGCDSYAEDKWRQISIDNILFKLPKPCARCPIPTVDPETGLTGKEPLTTLSKLRRWENKVYFGQNALHDKTGVLNVGSQVEIIELGANQPPIA